MQKLKFPILIIVLVFLILPFLLDYVVTEGLKKTEFNEFGKWNNSFKGKINADIIINGSSRAVLHISPKILEAKSNCNTYNLGIDSNTFYSQNKLFQIYKENNQKPKVIIQTVGDGTLMKPKKVYNQNQFLPYLDNESIAKMAVEFEGINSFDVNLPFYRYINHGTLVQIGFYEFFNIKKHKGRGFKGFWTKDTAWSDGGITETIKNSRNYLVKLEDESIEAFEEYVADSKKQGIIMFLVYTPEFIEFQPMSKNNEEIKTIFRNLADKYQIAFVDFSKHSISSNKEYFSNPVHLNAIGADVFTNELADKMLQEYKLKPCK